MKIFQRTDVVTTCLVLHLHQGLYSTELSLLISHSFQRNCLLQQLVEPNQFADTLITPQKPTWSYHTLCLNAKF